MDNKVVVIEVPATSGNPLTRPIVVPVDPPCGIVVASDPRCFQVLIGVPTFPMESYIVGAGLPLDYRVVGAGFPPCPEELRQPARKVG